MFALQLKANSARGRQVVEHVRGVTSAYRQIFYLVNYFPLVNPRLLHSNLQIFDRNVNSNVFGGYIKRFSRMGEPRGERLRTRYGISNSNSDKLSSRKLEFELFTNDPRVVPSNPMSRNVRDTEEMLDKSSAFQISRGPRKLEIGKARSSILGHLNKDPRFLPLKPIDRNVTNSSGRKDFGVVTIKPAVQQVCQRMILNSLGINHRIQYQVSEISPPKTSPNSEYNSLCSDDLDHQPWDKRIVIDASPKQSLHNYMQQVASHFNSHWYLIEAPTCVETKNGLWSCIYSLTWPYPINFMGQGINKKDASSSSAKAALVWLKRNHLMDDFGKPIYNACTLKPNRTISAIAGNIQGQVRSYSTSSRVDVNANLLSPTDSISPPIKLQTPSSEKVPEQEIKNARKFRTPKNTLHNYFQIVAQELNRKDLLVTPHYSATKQKKSSSWICTYNLKWPELIKFSGASPTKQDASHKAALAALEWLLQNKKITNDGRPLIYDKTEVKKMTKKNYPAIKIDAYVGDKMSEIISLYKNELIKELVTDLDQDGSLEGAGEELDEKWPQALNLDQNRQKYMGHNFYLAKEPVKLPISDYRDEIMKQLQDNRVLIIKGEPGCGKSTRVPQYVLEGWARDEGADGQPCRIIVTQPRRIAAISLAERVSNEREENVGTTVGYHVRLKSNFNKRTGHIMYCTTGILLRRLQSDPKLSDCSHIILDEAHERDVNTDLLMNLTRHALDLNPNLKVLVMSATMEAKVFQDYFGNAAVIHIPGFTYPVKEYYLNENNLPKTNQMCMGQFPNVIHEEVVKQIGMIHQTKPEGAILCFLPGWDDIVKVRNLIPNRADVSVLCLHSRLQVSEQQQIFARPPLGVRKIILATNIAETSITIDDVVYVIDTGIHKEERFDVEKGVNCIDNHWISKASATQRKGRAGRCQAGECFHLYPASKHEQFQHYSIPEILRTSLTKIVLDSKVYSNNMNAVEFLEQLVCPPDSNAIEKAVEELKELELLDENENLTPLGRTLSDFQLTPKLSKAMVNAVIFKCVTPVIDITTLFSADSALFAKSLDRQLEVKEVKSKFSKTSDHLAVMRIFEMWLEFIESNNSRAASEFCYDTGLVQHKLFTIQKLRDIHFDYLNKGLKRALPLADDFSDNDELVKAVLLSGVGTVLQHRNWDIVKGLLKKTNVLATRHNQKATITSESVNTRRGKFPSDFLLYINETISNLRHTTLVRETSVISPLSVLLFKSGELEIQEISKENCSEKLKSDDQVILKFKGTKIAFFCDRKQAEIVRSCKEAIRECVQYYIYQLTKGGETNENVNFHWNEILRNLDDILFVNSIEKN